jgi:hypothetical protein
MIIFDFLTIFGKKNIMLFVKKRYHPHVLIQVIIRIDIEGIRTRAAGRDALYDACLLHPKRIGRRCAVRLHVITKEQRTDVLYMRHWRLQHSLDNVAGHPYAIVVFFADDVMSV